MKMPQIASIAAALAVAAGLMLNWSDIQSRIGQNSIS